MTQFKIGDQVKFKTNLKIYTVYDTAYDIGINSSFIKNDYEEFWAFNHMLKLVEPNPPNPFKVGDFVQYCDTENNGTISNLKFEVVEVFHHLIRFNSTFYAYYPHYNFKLFVSKFKVGVDVQFKGEFKGEDGYNYTIKEINGDTAVVCKHKIIYSDINSLELKE